MHQEKKTFKKNVLKDRLDSMVKKMQGTLKTELRLKRKNFCDITVKNKSLGARSISIRNHVERIF
jgi:hypothetical protein